MCGRAQTANLTERMIEFYLPIKSVHIAAVIASGSLFALRGLCLLAGRQWPMALPWRLLSYGIDTVLLTAALMLATMLHQAPFVDAWLTVKVVMLVVYIVLGALAFKRGRTTRARWFAYVAALAVYGFIISVARAHDPAGLLRGLLSAG